MFVYLDELMPHLLATRYQNYEVMTSNKNFDLRPILQLFVIDLCAVIHLLNRKITKMDLHLRLKKNKSYVSKLPRAFVFRCAFDSAKFKV